MEIVAVVIPTLNEECSIGKVIDNVPVADPLKNGLKTVVYVIDGVAATKTFAYGKRRLPNGSPMKRLDFSEFVIIPSDYCESPENASHIEVMPSVVNVHTTEIASCVCYVIQGFCLTKWSLSVIGCPLQLCLCLSSILKVLSSHKNSSKSESLSS